MLNIFVKGGYFVGRVVVAAAAVQPPHEYWGNSCEEAGGL